MTACTRAARVSQDRCLIRKVHCARKPGCAVPCTTRWTVKKDRFRKNMISADVFKERDRKPTGEYVMAPLLVIVGFVGFFILLNIVEYGRID